MGKKLIVHLPISMTEWVWMAFLTTFLLMYPVAVLGVGCKGADLAIAQGLVPILLKRWPRAFSFNFSTLTLAEQKLF